MNIDLAKSLSDANVALKALRDTLSEYSPTGMSLRDIELRRAVNTALDLIYEYFEERAP